MKYFLDSAKMDEIKYVYETFGIDGVTTNPKHIMLSGKPFMTAITDIANWIKEEGLEGYEKFPVSVEINPHLDNAEAMVAEGQKISAICSNFVIKIPATEAGISAARRLEKMGIRTNVTLIFAPSLAQNLFLRLSDGRKQTARTAGLISRILLTFTRITAFTERQRSSVLRFVHLSRSLTVRWPAPISLQKDLRSIKTA